MRITEILLTKKGADRSLSSRQHQQAEILKQRIDAYADKIINPATPTRDKDFLKSKMKNDLEELKFLVSENNSKSVMEAINKLPLSEQDFGLLKELMNKPIPAIMASVYISDIIDDDALNDQLMYLEDTNPSTDIRPILAEWFKQVMPDQLYRFRDSSSTSQQRGVLSPIHGYDPHQYKGSSFTGTESSGNAYGRR